MFLIEKASEIAANTKENLLTAEKVADEKLTAAIDVLKGYFPLEKERIAYLF